VRDRVPTRLAFGALALCLFGILASVTSGFLGESASPPRSGRAAQVILIIVSAASGFILFWDILRLKAEHRRLGMALAHAEAERDAAIRSLSESHKFETLGRLTAGVGHDIGNVLQLIQVYLHAMPRSLGDEPALRRLMDSTMRAAERGASGVRNLLALVRGDATGGAEHRDAMAPQRVNSGLILADLAGAMQDLLGPAYTVRLDLAADLPPVLAMHDDLEAILINLATNASDAMLPAGGGTLSISAAVTRGPEAPESGSGPSGGPWVVIDVTDTGTGMDAATLARATDPFFTTKSRGRGVGLGLALVREFAERSGGALKLDSAPGRGTSARLYLLPASEDEVQDASVGIDPTLPGGLPQPSHSKTPRTVRHVAA